jgi:hypothetical protein
MSRNVLIATTALVLAAAIPSQVLGWGATGHRLIGTLAVKNLPDEIPAFLRTPDANGEIGELAREPDRWRGSGKVHDSERDPGHFVDASDDLTVLGGPVLKALPATRADYDGALRAVGTTQYKAGYLPYSIIDGWQQLREDFAYWRVAAAGEKYAASESDRAWFAADRKRREMLTVRDLGVWAHYVGDASQPLHVSVHYDVWGNYPNPEGLNTTKGFHLRFEGAFVRTNVSEGDIAALLVPYRNCGCAIEERTADYLIATQTHVLELFRMEKRHAFDGRDGEGKAFAAARLAAGVDELRDMIIDAWRASGDAKVGFHGIAVKDAESGHIDGALVELQGDD